MIRWIIMTALFLTVASIAGAADFNVGIAANKRGDYATAAREFQPLAEQGHAEAQYILGIMYSRGLGVPKDDREAVSWIRRAAEQSLAGAQVNLGIRYSTGDGVPKDYVQAYAWLNLAGAQGVGSARVIRDRLSAFMTNNQIAVAQQYSRELDAWIRRH